MTSLEKEVQLYKIAERKIIGNALPLSVEEAKKLLDIRLNRAEIEYSNKEASLDFIENQRIIMKNWADDAYTNERDPDSIHYLNVTYANIDAACDDMRSIVLSIEQGPEV